MNELIRRKIVDSLAASVPEFTRRDVHLPAVPGKALAVIGMRRTGKTTLLWQMLADRLAQGVPREALLYFSFDDDRLAGMSVGDLGALVEEYYRLHPEMRDRQTVTLFLDEIQVVPGWETFARRLLDTERVRLLLSGSSAKLLSREVATSMRGRAMEVLVHPFSFREYLRHVGREPAAPWGRLPKAARSLLERDLRLYLSQGGFPEAVGLSDARDRIELLRGYVDVVLLRDVVERHAVTHPLALRFLTRHLLANAAGSFSVSKLYNDVRSQGLSVAKDTLHGYLDHLQDCFLVRTVSVATDSERRRMVNPRKAYPVDPGLIPVFDRSGKANLGHALETCVLIELERQGAEVGYVRTPDGYEVDFLARRPGKPAQLLQVCTELADPATLEREVRALLAASEALPRASLHLIALDPDTSLELPESITLHRASSWLLGETNSMNR